MKKNIWIVIVVVVFFISLIITYTLAPPDRSVTTEATTATEKSH